SRGRHRAERAPRWRNRSSSDGSGRQARAAGGTPTDRRALRNGEGSRSFPQFAQKLAQAPRHLGGTPEALRRAHQHVDRPQLLLLLAEGFANTALQAVAIGSRPAVLARDQNAKPRTPCGAPLDKEGVAVGPQA